MKYTVLTKINGNLEIPHFPSVKKKKEEAEEELEFEIHCIKTKS